MSRERYQARSKKVQKLGRDGLVEQDRATGEEKRVSQRTADVSFGPERPVEHDAGRRGGQSGARARQRAQIRAQPEASGTMDGLERAEAREAPTPECPAAPRRADDTPLNRVSSEGGGDRAGRHGHQKASIREQLDPPQRLSFEQDGGALQFEPEREAADGAAKPTEAANVPQRGAYDTPAKRSNGGNRYRERREVDAADTGHDRLDTHQRLSFEQDSGGLQFEPEREVPAEAAAPEETAREVDAAAPRGAVDAPLPRYPPGKTAQRPAQSRTEGGGRLRFEPEHQDAPPDAPAPDTRTAAKRRQTAEHTPDAIKPERNRLRFEDAPQKRDKPVDAATPPRQQQRRGAEPVEHRAEQFGQVPQKTDGKPKIGRTVQPEPPRGNTAKPRRRLRFEEETPKPTPAQKQTGDVPMRAVRTAALMAAHGKMQEAEDGNVAVEAAHEGEIIAERGAGSALRWQRSRRQAASPAHAAPQRKRRLARTGTARRERPQFTSNPYSRWQQKRAIKRQYAAAKRAGTQTVMTANQTVARAAEAVRKKSADFVRRHKKGFLIVGVIVLVIAMFSSLMTSCSTLMQGGASAVTATTYPSEDADMLAAEAWYTAKEAELQTYLDTYEATHTYDEYHYTLDDIEHDPYVLISALTALHGGAWTIGEVQDTLQMLFDRQYILTETVTTEQRTHIVDGEQQEYTYYICTVTLENFNLSHVPVYIMGETQLSMYAAYMGALGNRPDLFPTSGYINRYLVQGYTEHEIPASALEDETFAAMIEEAEKYLGYPYVWGGSNPNTSFDCSGFVSWVINHSGWNVGRLGAQSLYNICTPTSNPKPGDLVFFTGTYDAGVPVSHVGLYVGDGWMIHAGDPISYCNIASSYYQSHFYAYGRLP